MASGRPRLRGVLFALAVLLLAAPAILSAATDAAPAVPVPRSDRQAVVTRHTVELRQVDAQASLQVGNGDFAFGTDVTGLQTFCGYTLSNWGWHEEPLPADLQPEDRKRTEFVTHEPDIKKIFDPFFFTKFVGRGLGLSVVLGLVRAHNGAITVVSAPGRGSTFRVYFPLLAQAAPRLPAGEAPGAPEAGGGTILLVEDEAGVRELAAKMLARLGFEVLTAPDGVEALALFQQHRAAIRCVLSDLTMPRMNGWATLTALRKLDPQLPVVLVSGYDEASVMAGDHPEQPQAFGSKPYTLKGLGDALACAWSFRRS